MILFKEGSIRKLCGLRGGEAGVLSKAEMGPISLMSLSYALNHARSPVRPREVEKDRHACAQ